MPLHLRLHVLYLFAVGVAGGSGKCANALKDANGKELFCGRGPNRVDCPADSFCQIHPADAFAVCCPNETSNSSPTVGTGTTPTPATTRVLVAANSKCPGGSSPLKDNKGTELFCGRGPNRVECPAGSMCQVDPLDRFAVCCSRPSSSSPQKCQSGQPLKNNQGVELFCGRGPNHVNCPVDSQCVVDPADRFAVCCPTGVNTNKCPGLVSPLTDAQGNELFCGRGPNRVDCPAGSKCQIDPADRFAVCCPPAGGPTPCPPIPPCAPPPNGCHYSQAQKDSRGCVVGCGTLNCNCGVGEEMDPLLGRCVPVSCRSPKACPAGQRCVATTINCIRAPCPQFECRTGKSKGKKNNKAGR